MAYYSPTPEENEAYKHLFGVATRGMASSIGGPDAVKFFVASGLPVPVLKQVWAIASSGQKEMGPREFSTAMRLIALAQNGYTIDENTLRSTESVVVGSPKFQGVEQPSPVQQPVATPPTAMATPSPPNPEAASPTSWAIHPDQRSGYEKLWNNLGKNAQGLLEGKDAAAFFAKSGQHRDILRKVWQLADVGGDGMMDLTEFVIGMHLTMMAKKGATLPATLPQDLLRSASAPFEKSGSNSSQLSASMMQMMQSNSIMGDSDKDLNQSKLTKQSSMKGDTSTQAPMAMSSTADGSDYDRLRQDNAAVNSSLQYAVGRMEDSRVAVKAQLGRASSELSGLKSERERLMQAFTDATNAFQADMDKLRQLDEELVRLREEVGRLRQGVDAKRAAIGAQQDLIGARLDETRNLSKQLAGASLGGASDAYGYGGQKRPAPSAPATSADLFQNSGFSSSETGGATRPPPAPPSNVFDSLEDPYSQ